MSAAAVYLAADGRELSPDEVKALSGPEKLAARERAARNAGIKEGRQRERKETEAANAAKDAAHAAALKATEAAFDKALQRQAKTHRAVGYHRAAWQFGIGMFVAGVVGACALLTFIVVPFNEQTRASTEAGVMIGTATRSQAGEPVTFTERPRDE
jgi:hypothetical protein